MQNIKAIFFDLDYTILDSKKAEEIAVHEFIKKIPELNGINEEEFEKSWHRNALALYERYNRREISFERQRLDRVKNTFAEFNILKNDEEAKEIFKVYLKLYEKNWILFEDTKEVLDYLKGKYKLGVITNGDSIQQRQKIKNTNMDEYFSQIIISGEVGFSKPEKEIFEIACKKIDEDPKNCLMVGDNLKVDVQGAIDAGLNGVWINRRNEKFEFKNQIKELTELLNII